MDIQQVAAELRKPVSAMPRIPFHNRFMLPIVRFLIDRLRTGEIAKGVSLNVEANRGLQLRVYTPDKIKSDGCVLWIHGGGLIIGSPKMVDSIGSEFARDLGVVVIAPQYRLAPKHIAPAAIDDCFCHWNWVLENTEALGVDPQKIIIGGQSAGGGLAACLAQRIADTEGPNPLGQVLVYPMLDDKTAADRSLDATNHLIWNNKANYTGWSSYLSRLSVGSESIPPYLVASRRKDLSGLPATWIGVGSLDLFLEENKTYAARLDEHGVPCEFEPVDGAPHGFDSFVPNAEISKNFIAAMKKFMARRLEIDAIN